MRPASLLAQLAGAALVLPLAACAKLPPSPIPAALTDREAELLAREHMNDRGVVDITLHSIRPDETGYLVAYQTIFEPTQTPPKSWRLVDVNNTGEVRELWWE